jgi:hypothetical protein
VERSRDLGGYAAVAASQPGLGEWQRAIDWRRGQLVRADIFDGHRLAMEIERPDPMVPARVRREPRELA